MGKDPAVLFYTSDFLSGVTFFTDSQIGIYIKLLCYQHQLKEIPKDFFDTLVGTDKMIRSKFAETYTGYYNERMRIEANRRAAFCESRKKNRKNNNICATYVEHMNVHMENENRNRDLNDNYNQNNDALDATGDKGAISEAAEKLPVAPQEKKGSAGECSTVGSVGPQKSLLSADLSVAPDLAGVSGQNGQIEAVPFAKKGNGVYDGDQNQGQNAKRGKNVGRIDQKNIVPPKIEWVEDYCQERKNSVDPKQFFDHNEARGWIPKGGTRKIVDWQAAVRTWEKYNYRQTANTLHLDTPRPRNSYGYQAEPQAQFRPAPKLPDVPDCEKPDQATIDLLKKTVSSIKRIS